MRGGGPRGAGTTRPPAAASEPLGRDGPARRGARVGTLSGTRIGVDPDLAPILGDFGPGADAPIVLDYRPGATRPRVLRLRWSRREGDRWIVAAPEFAALAAAPGLTG